MAEKKHLMYASAIFFLLGVVLSGCSEDEDPAPDKGKKATVTFSVSSGFSKEEGDEFSLTVSGAGLDGTFIDWKVDDKTEKGTIVSVTSDYVDGGNDNVLIQSVQDFDVGSVSVSSFNIGGERFTVTYKVEMNGAVVDEQAVEIGDGDDPLYKNYKL